MAQVHCSIIVRHVDNESKFNVDDLTNYKEFYMQRSIWYPLTIIRS